MRRGFLVALVVAGCLAAAARVHAQTPAGGDGTGAGQSTHAAAGQKPAAAPAQGAANPFPEDTSAVPVMPSSGTPVLPEGTYSGEDSGTDSGRAALPGDDLDPVRSPDDPAPAANSGQEQDSSSSLAGMDKLLPGPDDDQPQGKKRKLSVKEPEHQETSKEDLDVGKYYLEIKNWKAALSRFESAMVLAPEEPEVFWGLAEAERNLGHFAEARTYYLKLLDYDPDGPHGKASRKALKEPEIANAKAASPAQPAVETVK
ncbi:MAG TPA: tetratricopeptide repeat protein [Terracidiphilus sp.]